MNDYEEGQYYITEDHDGSYQGIGYMYDLYFQDEDPDDDNLVFTYDSESWEDLFDEEDYI